MPQVSIQIANRTYELACGDGEEERVQELAAYVDGKITELRKQLARHARSQAAGLRRPDPGRREPRGPRHRQGGGDSARASATDSAETLATALEDLITSRVDKMSKRSSGAA